jgi:hypothetical protein
VKRLPLRPIAVPGIGAQAARGSGIGAGVRIACDDR